MSFLVLGILHKSIFNDNRINNTQEFEADADATHITYFLNSRAIYIARNQYEKSLTGQLIAREQLEISVK